MLTKLYRIAQQFNSLLFVAFEVPVIAHWSLWLFLLVLLLVSPADFVLWLLALLSIIPHEYGHVLAARRYGIGCEKITMFPIGGMAFLKDVPETPWQEFVIAIAGPAVTAAIMVTAALGAFMSETLLKVAMINLILLVFNMLPCFPMDGGRVLRAFLGCFGNQLWATKWAVRTSYVMFAFMAAVGVLLMVPALMIMPIILLPVASMEYQMVEEREKQKKEKQDNAT